MSPFDRVLDTLITIVLAMATLFVLLCFSCGGKIPETRYYQLATPAKAAQLGDLVVAIEALQTDPGYDDERIVYRTTPYRLDYYQYHRWSSPPGVMIGNFLEQALERSGKFRAVLRETSEGSPMVVRGRVIAIEEVDKSKTSWFGRIAIELTLTDSKTGEVMWSEQFEELEPLRLQTQEGLAEALTTAMSKIAAKVAPVIADRVNQSRTAASHE